MGAINKVWSGKRRLGDKPKPLAYWLVKCHDEHTALLVGGECVSVKVCANVYCIITL